ncbi:restriction endonuclease subunit S [Streptomyces sp. AD681]|uniref:restriction endonuclease subunit S n=1 Tax=Streptomyces sp. AD681 TaxID=3019069 RepID=UPI0022F1C1BA|nr:restriction endonuclease subunit S [Streptomyces sp. AD681]MDA5146493.1 restriction endonuclease subunit S [Streptomyces sp. AD681]
MTQTLDDVCTVIVDSEHKTAPVAESGTEFALSVGTPHVRNGRLLLSDAVAVDEETYREWTVRGVPAVGDLILTREAPVGDVGMIPAGVRICLRQRTVLLRPDSRKINGNFLLYLLASPQLQERMHSKGAGSTVPHLNIKDVRALLLGRLPSRGEQDAVAEVLVALDEKIVLNEQHAETALELAGYLYERESAEHGRWSESALKDTAKWLSGGTPRTSEPSYWGGDIPWISAASLKTPWLYTSERSVTELGVQNGTRLVPKGAILFVVRGMSLTTEFRVGIAQREVAFGQDCKALIPHASIDPVTLFLAIRAQSPKILGMVDLAGHGTGRLVTERVANLRVRLPHGEAAAGFAARAGALMHRAVAVTNENRTLADLRDTLLPQLLSGKLRVKDAVRTVEEVV